MYHSENITEQALYYLHRLKFIMNKRLLALPGIFLMLLSLLSSCKKDETTISKTGNAALSPIELPLSTGNIAVDSLSKTLFLFDQTGNPAYIQHNYQGCPTIGFDGNTLFAAWQSGGAGEQPGNYISVAVSTDGGTTWMQHKLIISSKDTSVRHFDPMFWRDKYGHLNLTWASSKGMWDGGALGAWFAGIKYVDDRITVTKPMFMFHGVMSTKPTPIGRDSAKLLYAVSGFMVSNNWNNYPTTATPPNLAGAFAYTSAYNGQMLTIPQMVAPINSTGLKIDFAEPMIVNLGNSNYEAIIRTKNGTYTSSSSNAGVTWDAPVPFTTLGATTGSKSFFGRLKSGGLLFVLNNSSARTNLTAYLSKNNGRTWPYKVVIDTRAAVSYPDVIQTITGEILLVYDRERTQAQEINFVKLTEQNIVDGKLNSNAVVISHK